MIIDINIDVQEGMANVTEQLDCGTIKIKNVSLDEFLQNYISMKKEKEDNYQFLYMPAGTVEYRKNINSITMVVQTYPYKSFYGVDNMEDDYLVIVKTNLEGTELLESKGFTTNGAFNKHFSSFRKVYDCKNRASIVDETDAIFKVLKSVINGENKKLQLKQKYKDIV